MPKPSVQALGDYNILTGLSWLTESDEKQLKEIIKAEKVDKAGVIRIKRNSKVTQQGYCSLRGIREKSLYSAAALFASYQMESAELLEHDEASQSSTWIAIEEFEKGYWVSLINAGQVVTESSPRLTEEDTLQLVQELLSEAQSESLNPILVGGAVQKLGSPSETCVTLEYILGNGSKEEIENAHIKDDKGGQLKSVAIIVVGGAVLLYQLNSSFGIFSNELSEDEQKRAQIEASKQVVVQYYEVFQKLPRLSYSVSSFYNTVHSNQLADAPWLLKALNCQYQTSQCTASFINPKNLSTSLISTFLSARCDSFDIATQGNTASCILNLFPNEIDTEYLGNDVLGLTEQLLKYTNSGHLTKVSNPIQSQIPGGEFAPADMLYKEGVWEIKGDLLSLNSVASSNSNLPWVRTRSIKLDQVYPTMKITVEGSYVIK